LPGHHGRTGRSARGFRAAQQRDRETEFDRRLDRMLDDMTRTMRTWLILIRLVVVETIAIVVLLTHD
jgi:hypothetical protein